MTPEAAVSATYVWLIIYGIGAALFFGIAFWVIYRGGKDVLELLKTDAKAGGPR